MFLLIFEFKGMLVVRGSSVDILAQITCVTLVLISIFHSDLFFFMMKGEIFMRSYNHD